MGLLLLTAWLALAAGCKEDTGLNFSHAGHQARTPDCLACHPRTAQGELARAGHEQCQACHRIDVKQPGQDCLSCHTELNRRVQKRARPSFASSAPRHQEHAGAGMSCQTCHGEVGGRGFSAGIDFPRMEECVSCHFPAKGVRGLTAECRYCHQGRQTREIQPASHRPAQAWTLAHGKNSQAEPFFCQRCHQDRSCEQCHRVSPPRDHNNVFRQRGHGMMAVSNPQRCDTCHKQDFCLNCHRSVQPKYHTASFKSTRPYTHCGMCHIPLDEGNRCRACHRQLSHARAMALAPSPPPIVPVGTPCLTCHPVALVPIKHLYNTVPDTECTQCHRYSRARPGPTPRPPR